MRVFQKSGLPEYYRENSTFPAGFELHRQTFDGATFNDKLHLGLKAALERGVSCPLMRIPLPDRALSFSIVHEVVPKHSDSVDCFIEHELPEILRVTDDTAFIYPMSVYTTVLAGLDEKLEMQYQLVEKEAADERSTFAAKVNDTAVQCGFTCILKRGGISYLPTSPGDQSTEGGIVGIFTRIDSLAMPVPRKS